MVATSRNHFCPGIEFDDTVTLSPPSLLISSAGHRDAADFQLEFSGQIGLSDAVQSLTPDQAAGQTPASLFTLMPL